jgi:hypothetical protein
MMEALCTSVLILDKEAGEMKKFFTWRFWISMILVACSAVTYFVHYLIFRDVRHIFIYMTGDFAFMFIDIMVVIIVIERLLSQREKQALLNKLNMAIGTFFSEVGLELLKKFSTFVANASALEKQLVIESSWTKKDYEKAISASSQFSYDIEIDKPALQDLQEFLLQKRSFLLQLLENPNLLEHERFTDVLWAVFHLAEELAFRGDQISRLPSSDYDHLRGDLKRAYSKIVSEWIAHVQHLRASYPFLFSLAARINPFSPSPSAIIS